MSTDIVDNGFGAIMAVERCDDCKKVLSRRPATAYERNMVGTCTLVCDWCKDCSPKHSFTMDAPIYEVRGMSIGNPSAIAKVRIET
jgi:hypothetical protein